MTGRRPLEPRDIDGRRLILPCYYPWATGTIAP